MEKDGVTRVFYLRNDSTDQYLQQIYPTKQAKTSDQRAIQQVESRVDAHFMAIHRAGECSWQLLEQSRQFSRACGLKLSAEVAKGPASNRHARLVAYIEDLKQQHGKQSKQQAFTIVVG